MLPSGPAPTVDVIIEIDGTSDGIVLIERKHDPLGWAIPGGFVDDGESVADAARREAKEETGLDVDIKELFHVYSDPRRDPRRHTISVVFLAVARGEPQGGDDAASARVFSTEALPHLVFDHATIIEDYLRYRATGQRPPVDR